MAPQPEEQARAEIDRLLGEAGWSVQDYKQANLHAARGVALREFRLEEEESVSLPDPRIGREGHPSAVQIPIDN